MSLAGLYKLPPRLQGHERYMHADIGQVWRAATPTAPLLLPSGALLLAGSMVVQVPATQWELSFAQQTAVNFLFTMMMSDLARYRYFRRSAQRKREIREEEEG